MKRLTLTLTLTLTLISTAWADWTTFNATTTRYSRTDTAFDITAFTVCVNYNKLTDGEGNAGRFVDKGGGDWRLTAITASPSMGWLIDGWTITDGNWRALETPRTFVCIAYDGGNVTNDPLFCFYGTSQSLTTDINPTGTWTPTTAVLNIGNNSGAGATFDGQLGDFLFYSEKFTTCDEAQAVGHYGWMARPKGIVASIHLGGFAGLDYSGNGKDFTVNSAGTTSTTGPTRSNVPGGFIWLQ